MSDLVGNMDKVVVFKQNAPTALGAGNKDGYSTLLTTRGYLKKSVGSRNSGFSDILGDSSYFLTVRKQAALTAALKMSLKVEIENRTYTIQGWEDIEEEHFYYRFSLTRQDA